MVSKLSKSTLNNSEPLFVTSFNTIHLSEVNPILLSYIKFGLAPPYSTNLKYVSLISIGDIYIIIINL